MPKIYVQSEVGPGELGGHPFGKAIVVIQVSPYAEGFLVQCSGDGIDECPGDLEPGHTWAEGLNAVAAAWEHARAHEHRGSPTG
jgi:hypothetical protein